MTIEEGLINFKQVFKSRLPHREELWLVYGVVLFAISSWMVRAFLYKAPSLILFMDMGEIGSVFAYMMAFAFLESLLTMIVLIIPSFLLPRNWYQNGFVYKATLIVAVATVTSVFYQEALTTKFMGNSVVYEWVLSAGVVMVLLILISHQISWIQRAIRFVAEQISVMIYIYVPIGVISLVVTITRMLI